MKASRLRLGVFLISQTMALLGLAACGIAADRLPNVILILADDLGYADVGIYGADGFSTPNLDRLAGEGVRFTDFHVAQAVCSASRAALMTGCYPNRVGITGAVEPWDKFGLHVGEMTLPQMMKQKGYATGMVGKWHLGRPPEFLPTHRGFDEFFGLPYSNDQWPFHPEKPGVFPPLPLIEGDRVINPAITKQDMEQLTTWYTEHAVNFIRRNRNTPFFLYFAHTMPHVPLAVSDKYRGKTRRGLYGDACAEIDWSTGEILDVLKELSLENDTLVMFLSDNGPWLSYGNHGGSAHPLREGKTTSWEGGTRVPFIARWPGHLPAAKVCDEMAMSIDLLPTLARLIGATLPNHKIDGMDIWPLLSGQPGATNPHPAYFFYGVPFGGWTGAQLEAVRSGPWKLILPHSYRTLGSDPPGKDGIPAKYQSRSLTAPELYDLKDDVSEQKNVASQHPDIVKRLMELADQCRNDLGDTIVKREGSGIRPHGIAAAADSSAAEAKQDARATPTVLPHPNMEPGAEYSDAARMFQGIPAIERAPNGRLWAAWYGGGITEDQHNYILLDTSADDGRTWQRALILDPDKDGPIRAFDPCLWHDTEGKLWLFWAQRAEKQQPELLAINTTESGEAAARWSEPRRICEGIMMNKPTVTRDGTWLLPVALWHTEDSARVIASCDRGASFTRIGAARIPEKKDRNCDEHMLIQRKDGPLWLLVRTRYGIGESVSLDGGSTWPEIAPSSIHHPVTRFFIRRLSDGKLLLVRHDPPPTAAKTRSHLAAFLSADDGKTWDGRLLLDERKNVSYPDAVQRADGLIYLIYDFERQRDKEILMATFREADVLARRPLSPDTRLRALVNKASGINPTIRKTGAEGAPQKKE